MNMKDERARRNIQHQHPTKVELNTSEPGTEDKEYYRPSFMFHWLKATGRRVDEAYEAFRNYNGKASYEELGLGIPTPMPQEEDDSEWTHE